MAKEAGGMTTESPLKGLLEKDEIIERCPDLHMKAPAHTHTNTHAQVGWPVASSVALEPKDLSFTAPLLSL